MRKKNFKDKACGNLHGAYTGLRRAMKKGRKEGSERLLFIGITCSKKGTGAVRNGVLL